MTSWWTRQIRTKPTPAGTNRNRARLPRVSTHGLKVAPALSSVERAGDTNKQCSLVAFLACSGSSSTPGFVCYSLCTSMAQSTGQASRFAFLQGSSLLFLLLVIPVVLSNHAGGAASGILVFVVIFFFPGYLLLTLSEQIAGQFADRSKSRLRHCVRHDGLRYFCACFDRRIFSLSDSCAFGRGNNSLRSAKPPHCKRGRTGPAKRTKLCWQAVPPPLSVAAALLEKRPILRWRVCFLRTRRAGSSVPRDSAATTSASRAAGQLYSFGPQGAGVPLFRRSHACAAPARAKCFASGRNRSV